MEIQAMLQNREFSNKFNKAFMKYSRNYESSFYINEYGIGTFIDLKGNMYFFTFLTLVSHYFKLHI